MENRDERLETAMRMIEMHLGIFITKDDAIAELEKSDKRKQRSNKFGNEFAKMEGKLKSNRTEAYEEEFIRVYADLMKRENSESKH